MARRRDRLQRMAKVVLLMSVVALGSGGGSARAQTSYPLDGTPMLREVMNKAIAASGANFTYISSSSDQAEGNMWPYPNLLPPGRVAHLYAGIAPMSRNLTSDILYGEPSWAPTDENVIALSVGVIAVSNINGRCQNITEPLVDWTNPSIGQVTTDLSILFSGYPAGGPGSQSNGTTKECADPQRLAALARLVSCQGVNRIDHIYRHDDMSGLGEIFQEHLQFVRWCNGKSNGNWESSGSNLKNSDLDPIRRPCTTVSGDGSKAPSRCTFFPLDYPPIGSTCHDGDVLAANDRLNPYGVPIPCTQGLIVALSEPDPGVKDVNLSIGRRIAADLNGYTAGLTGLAAVTQIPNQANVGVNVNTVTFEEANVRSGQYMLWNRLFLQRRPDAVSSGLVAPAQNLDEMKLFDWATDRCKMKTIIEDAGYIAPLSACTDACTDPLNVTCLTAEPNDWLPLQNIGGETTPCDVSYPCVTNGMTASASGASCGGGTDRSGNATCPSIPALPAGYACNLSAKCASGGGCGLDASGVNTICR